MSILDLPPIDLAPRIVSADPADFPMPTQRQEEWRFAPVDALASFMERQSEWGTLGCDSKAYVRIDAIPADALLPVDRPSAVARQGAASAIVVEIPAGVVVDDPIVVALTAASPGAYGQVHVRAGRDSRATVAVIHDLSADTSGTLDCVVGDGAHLTVASIVDGDETTRHLWQWPVRVGRDASYVAVSVTMGGSVVRMCPSVAYSAPGGSADLWGAFLVEGDRYSEHRVFVEHTTPHCDSNVTYKGALTGSGARSAWVGDVLVRRDATATRTYELNRNLLLDDGPRADSVPNLELETGDVISAGHASATGRFDDEQLFYLQARGIPEQLARQLVVRGFFADVLARIPALQHQFLARLEARLGMPTADL